MLVDRVDRDDVGMVERGDRTRFALEAVASLGVVGQRVREHLQGDAATELRVVGEEDFAHATRADRADDAVVGKGRWDHRRAECIAAAPHPTSITCA